MGSYWRKEPIYSLLCHTYLLFWVGCVVIVARLSLDDEMVGWSVMTMESSPIPHSRHYRLTIVCGQGANNVCIFCVASSPLLARSTIITALGYAAYIEIRFSSLHFIYNLSSLRSNDDDVEWTTSVYIGSLLFFPLQLFVWVRLETSSLHSNMGIFTQPREKRFFAFFCYFVIFEEMKSRMRVWKARVDKRRLPWCWRVAKRKANAGGSLKFELRRKRELLTEISSVRFSARLLVYVTRLFPLFTQQSGRPLWDASQDIELPHSCALLEWFSIHFDELKAIIDRGFVHSYLKLCRRTPTCFNYNLLSKASWNM